MLAEESVSCSSGEGPCDGRWYLWALRGGCSGSVWALESPAGRSMKGWTQAVLAGAGGREEGAGTGTSSPVRGPDERAGDRQGSAHGVWEGRRCVMLAVRSALLASVCRDLEGFQAEMDLRGL